MSEKAKKKILLVQHDLNPHGGQDAVAVWILEALKDIHEITVLSWIQCDFNRINDYYGTSISQLDCKSIVAPSFLRSLVDRIPNDPWHFQRLVFLMRWTKMIKHNFDVIISANNELDFGCRGIQYIHYPYQEVNWPYEPVHFKKKGWR